MSQADRAPVTLDQDSVGRLSRIDAMQVQAMALAQARRRQTERAAIDAALRRIDDAAAKGELQGLKGEGRPPNTPRPSCSMGEVLPCISVLARTTSPPKAWPIDWWPRQTPRMGMVSAAVSISDRQMPA